METGTEGFTLLELMLTVILAGLLIAVATPQFQERAERGAAARAEKAAAACEKDTTNRPANCPAKKQIEQPRKLSIL